jgi:hypothetical protein
MTQENLEPQDEMKEVFNEQENAEETNPVGQEEGLGQSESAEEISTEEGVQEQEKVDQNDPVFQAGQKAMQQKMQEALNKRIAKEVGKRKAIENQFDDFRKEFAELKQNMAPKVEKPKIEDFEDPNDFVKASMDYQTKMVAPKPQQKPNDPDPTVLAFAQKEQEYAKSHPSYYDKVNQLIPFTQRNPALLDAIYDSGPEVADYLADNLDIVDDMSGMGPARIGRAIAQLENQFKRSQPLPKKANPKPAPTAEHRGNTGGTPDITKLSKQEYAKYMAGIHT